MDFDSVNDLFKQADMMRAYHSITDAQGPSQQLIDFINHDRSIGKEIGLESFEGFSTQAQHEILASKLNPDVMEAIACEGFKDFTVKYRRWLLVGGLFIWPLWIGAIVGYVNKPENVKALPVGEVKKLNSSFEAIIEKAENAIHALPSKFEEGVWSNYTDKVKVTLDTIEDLPLESNAKLVAIKNGGWNPSSFHSLASDYDRNAKSFTKIREAYANKLVAIEKFTESTDEKNRSAVKHVSAATSSIMKILHKGDGIARVVKSEIAKASKGFVFEQK